MHKRPRHVEDLRLRMGIIQLSGLRAARCPQGGAASAQAASELKEAGNKLHQAGKYEAAIGNYQRALDSLAGAPQLRHLLPAAARYASRAALAAWPAMLLRMLWERRGACEC